MLSAETPPIIAPMSWLKITDPQWDDNTLAAEIEQRTQQRNAELGALTPTFPAMSNDGLHLPSATEKVAPQLYQQLKALQQRKPVETGVLLADSPATGIPIIGRIWRMVRGSLHELVLFYVNRLVRDQAQREGHLLNIVNELTRLTVQQEQEIGRLRDELRRRDAA